MASLTMAGSLASLLVVPAIENECPENQCYTGYTATMRYPFEHEHPHNDTQEPYAGWATPSSPRGATGYNNTSPER
jgi:hypothetical protein